MERRRRRLAVDEVRKRISHWRKMRPKPKSMPEELWAAAVSLTTEHGVCRIARDLGLNFAALKERARRLETSSAVVPTRDVEGAPRAVEPNTTFVELDPAQLFGGPRHGASVTLAAADGATMTIQLPLGQPFDLVALADSFWRRGA